MISNNCNDSASGVWKTNRMRNMQLNNENWWTAVHMLMEKIKMPDYEKAKRCLKNTGL